MSLASQLLTGCDKLGYGFGGTGKKSFGRQFDSYGESFGLNDVIGCYLDRENHTIKFRSEADWRLESHFCSKNGQDLGVAFEIAIELQNVPLYPAVVLKNAEIRFNFGTSPFKFTPVCPG